MTATDDLEIGMHVAIVGVREEASTQNDLFGFRQTASMTFDGTPLKILAISLPFICVSTGRQNFGLDVRKFQLQRLNDAYVQLMTPMNETLASRPSDKNQLTYASETVWGTNGPFRNPYTGGT